MWRHVAIFIQRGVGLEAKCREIDEASAECNIELETSMRKAFVWKEQLCSWGKSASHPARRFPGELTFYTWLDFLLNELQYARFI